MHGESKHENCQHGEKASQVLHEVADDDGPGSEEVVEREEVENLHASQQKAQGEPLISAVDQGPVALDPDYVEEAEEVSRHPADPENQDRELDPAQAALVARIGQFEQQQAG